MGTFFYWVGVVVVALLAGGVLRLLPKKFFVGLFWSALTFTAITFLVVELDISWAQNTYFFGSLLVLCLYGWWGITSGEIEL